MHGRIGSTARLVGGRATNADMTRYGCARKRVAALMPADPNPDLPRDRPHARSPSSGRRVILHVMRPVDAVYENGLLRPVSDLPLRSGERVRVIVVRRGDTSRWDSVKLAARPDDDLALAEAGLDEWAAALEREDRG